MGRLFGTDGVRGVANEDLTSELALNIGRAAATVLTKHLPHVPKILIGKDPRISSDMLECALEAGICSVGANAVSLGVVPTPAVAYLVREYKADAGVVISASHNSAEFNGIKIFNGDGYKLDDSIENEIETLILDTPEVIQLKKGAEVGRLIHSKHAAEDYIKYIKSIATVDFEGLDIAIDCANGSSSVTAQKLFTALGAKCHMLSDQPDGVNINFNCGSTHLGNLMEYVIENGCDAGVAFDGDADRCLMVSENGEVVDGDKLIAIAALDMKNKGELKKDTAVVTVMSNLGFFKFAKNNGIHTEKTKVGDRYVLENMIEHGFNIGGEQSGHIIFLDHATTGDGELTAVKVMTVLKQSGETMSHIASVMDVFPQILVNLTADDSAKKRYGESEEIREHIEKKDAALGDDGRILVRSSGTEPLIRVMVEGKNQTQINEIANEIAEYIKERIF